MRGFSFRAICVAAGLLAVSASALADSNARADRFASFTDAFDATPMMARARIADDFVLPSAPDVAFGPPSLALAAPVSAHLALSDQLGFDFGTNSDLVGRFNRFGVTANMDGLFLSARALTPYAALASGGSFVSATIALADDLHFSIGQASVAPGQNARMAGAAAALAQLGGAPLKQDARSVNSLLAGVSWDFAHWGGLGVTASQTSEREGLLGAPNMGIDGASTTALDVSAHVGLGGGWVTTASFSQGVTKLDLKPGFAFSSDTLPSRSYGIAVAKNGLFGNDTLGVAVSRPAFDFTDGSVFAVDSGAAQMKYLGRDHLLEGLAPETDIEVGYVTTFLDGSVALQTNADFQMNLAGQNGANAVSLLSRAKIKF
jgi:hypothetical protein